MQIDTSLSTVPKPSNLSWIFSLIIVWIVIVSGVGFFVSNSITSKTLDTNRNTLATLDAEITKLSQDRQVMITKIIQWNTIRPSLDIKGLIASFKDAAIKSNVRLQWFSVVNDTISTNLISTSGDPEGHSDAAATIIKMMREYASGQKAFGLEPILTISGEPSRRVTSIQLKVVSRILQ
mgnify:CR=1 FL=1